MNAMQTLQVDPGAAVAPFEQIRTQIAASVADGRLSPGEKLPTVRDLAVQLGVAVNTVARAYRELEAEGVIVTEGRRGSFVRRTGLAHPDSAADLQAAADRYAVTARRAGVSLPEALHLVERAWTPPG